MFGIERLCQEHKKPGKFMLKIEKTQQMLLSLYAEFMLNL